MTEVNGVADVGSSNRMTSLEAASACDFFVGALAVGNGYRLTTICGHIAISVICGST